MSISHSKPKNSKTDQDVLGNFRAFLSNTFEKAKVSGLGEDFYRAIYPALSRMVHQSYIYVEREAGAFTEEADDPDSINRLVLCMNVITFSLVERALDDVGSIAHITPP